MPETGIKKLLPCTLYCASFSDIMCVLRKTAGCCRICLKQKRGGVDMITGLITGAAVAAKALAVAKTVSTIGTVMLSVQTIADGIQSFINKD